MTPSQALSLVLDEEHATAIWVIEKLFGHHHSLSGQYAL